MDKVSGGHLLAKSLQQWGVTEVFSLHGGHLDTFLIECKGSGIRLTDTRHEASAGHAAEGYARTTGKVGVCVVTAGPGFTNAYSAIANAYLDRIPTIFIVGAPATSDTHLNVLQGGLDQIACAIPVTRWAYRVSSGAQIPEVIDHAMRVAKSAMPGPVLIEVPIDAMFVPVKCDYVFSAPGGMKLPCGAGLSESDAKDIITLLHSSERPVIIPGGGAVHSRCGELLLQLAEITGIPVAAGMKANGILPPDHSLNAMNAISMAVAASVYETESDGVLLLGQRVGLFTGGADGIIPKSARVAQIDSDSSELGRGRNVEIAVVADCYKALEALVAVAKTMVWKDLSKWAGMLRGSSQLSALQWQDAAAESEQGRLHPYYATKALIEALPSNAIIVCDGGESSIWVRDHIRTSGEGSFLIVGYLGTLGVGQGYAIGAARACPDRPVYLFAGDGGVGFHIQEFDTMVRHNLNIHTVVLNNACWGMSQNGQDLMYGKQRRSIVELSDTAYEIVAEGFGCKGMRVERMHEIAPAIHETWNASMPYCINVRIDESVINPYTYVMIGLAAPVEGDDKAGGVVIPYYDNLDA